MKIVIIDYGLCNLRSVHNALLRLGYDSIVSDDPNALQKAHCVILPGVGAFEDGMRGLREKGFIKPINDYVQTGRPFLGICLGMQMLMSKSYEFGEHEGLNLIEGEVVRFQSVDDLKIPHIGWNHLEQATLSWDETPLASINNREEMYFVHSFYVSPTKQENVLAQTEYGGQTFCSVVAKDNVFGCQFHPEKSSAEGLKILKNFIENKRCLENIGGVSL